MNRLHGLAEAAAYLPTELGYVPTRHVVIMAQKSNGAILFTGAVAADENAEAGIRKTAAVAARHHAAKVVAFTFGLDRFAANRWHRTVREVMTGVGLIVAEVARVEHSRIWIGREGGEGTQVPRLDSSANLLEATANSRPAPTREDMVAEWQATGTLVPFGAVTAGQGAQAWHDLLSGETLDDEAMCAALGLIDSLPGRDCVLSAFGGLMKPEDCPTIMQPARDLITPAVRDTPLPLLLARIQPLVRQADPAHATNALIVAAVVSWYGGNNAISAICVGRVLDADPTHSLARLLHEAVSAGLPAPTRTP